MIHSHAIPCSNTAVPAQRLETIMRQPYRLKRLVFDDSENHRPLKSNAQLRQRRRPSTLYDIIFFPDALA